MSHKFLAGAGLLVLAGWGVSGLAVAGSDIKQVDLTLRILVDGPPPCSVKGSAVELMLQAGGDISVPWNVMSSSAASTAPQPAHSKRSRNFFIGNPPPWSSWR